MDYHSIHILECISFLCDHLCSSRCLPYTDEEAITFVMSHSV